jgi:hypothetical protein
MTVEQIRRVYESQPFRPFILHLADGRQVAVAHREFLALSPTGRTVIVYQPDESFNVVDLLLVTDLEFEPESGRRGKRGRPRG